MRELLGAAGVEAGGPGTLQPGLQAADVRHVAAPAEQGLLRRLRRDPLKCEAFWQICLSRSTTIATRFNITHDWSILKDPVRSNQQQCMLSSASDLPLSPPHALTARNDTSFAAI